MAQERIAWRIALLCLLRAITVSGACTPYANITIDHTKGPSGTNYVFSFTRINVIIDYDSQVRFSDNEFTRLLWCFMGQSANPNICQLIPQISGTIGSLFLYSASVVGSFSTGADVSPKNGEHNRRYYVCVIPDRLSYPPGNLMSCTEQTLPSDCFSDTDTCITLSRIDTELKSYVHVLFRSEGQISVQYNSDIVVVDSCNPSTTTTVTTSSSSGSTTETTGSPKTDTTGTNILATEDAGNTNVLYKESDNTGLIFGAVCGSLLIIALIVIGILCWKLRVAVWKRGRKLSTDSTPTGLSTSNQSRPSTDDLMYNNQETYPLPETNHHNISSISTSDYISLDSINSDILETPNGHIGNFKDDKEVTDGQLKAETVFTSKTINLTKPKAKKSEKFKEKKTEKNGPEYFNVA